MRKNPGDVKARTSVAAGGGKKGEESSAVALKKEAQLPAEYDYGEFAGAGFEGTSREDYLIPFLYLLQNTSPQLDASSPAYMEEARAGMLFNTATRELYAAVDAAGKEVAGVLFVPCFRQHLWVEWTPRDAGGGYVDAYNSDDPRIGDWTRGQEFGRYKAPNGNDLIETFYLFALTAEPDGTFRQVIVPFNSTKIRAYREFITRADLIRIQTPTGAMIKPPLFSHRWRLKAVGQKNNKGSFFNLRVTMDGKEAIEARLRTDSPLYKAAQEFYLLAKDGVLRANTSTLGRETDVSTEEVPF